MRKSGIVILFAVLMLCPFSAFAQTLLKHDSGKVVPLLAVSFEKLDETSVKLVVPENIAANLKIRLESEIDGVSIRIIDSNTFVIGAANSEMLIEKLCEIEVEGENSGIELAPAEPADKKDDPFNNMVASADLSLSSPDGSSSIRVAKTLDNDMIRNQFEAIVLEVRKKSFPAVQLLLKITSEPLAQPENVLLVKDKEIVARPFFTYSARPGMEDANSLDLNDPATRANIVGWFLKKGDKVVLTAGGQSNGMVNLTSIKRKP